MLLRGHRGDGCDLASALCMYDLASALCRYDLRKGDLFVLRWERV